MTPLTKAMRNELARDTDLRALLGSSPKWDSWIFLDKPEVKIEGTGKSLIVISTYDQTWATSNMHNTMEFPTIMIDIWCDPTRNTDLSVRVEDGEDKMTAIHKLVKKHFHTVDTGNGSGGILQWGTQTQVDNMQGVFVAGSHLVDGPRTNQIANVPGGMMGSTRYGVNLVS